MDTVNVRSHLKGVGRAKEFVQNYCRCHEVPASLADNFCIILDEFLSNIIPAATSPRISLTIDKAAPAGADAGQTAVPPRRLVFTSAHAGPRYDISDENNLVWPEEEVKAKFSVLTLHRLHKYLDQIECRYENGENIVTLAKDL